MNALDLTTDPALLSFAQRLRIARHARGWSQAQALEKVLPGGHLITWQQWEQGRRVPARWVQRMILMKLEGKQR